MCLKDASPLFFSIVDELLVLHSSALNLGFYSINGAVEDSLL